MCRSLEGDRLRVEEVEGSGGAVDVPQSWGWNIQRIRGLLCRLTKSRRSRGGSKLGKGKGRFSILLVEDIRYLKRLVRRVKKS